MIKWSEGEIRGSDGQKYREVPQKGTWASSIWVSQKGDAAYRRFYDVITCRWKWGGSIPWVIDENSCRLGIYVNWWVSREMVVALAWRHRETDSPSRVVIDDGKDVHARCIQWSEEEECVDDGVIQGETWRPLRGWRCGVVPIPDGYQISSQGRLKTPAGKVTSGFWYQALETRMADVRGCGLVDLFVAAKIKPNTVYLPPSLKQAVDCILSGNGPQDLADATGLSLATAWGYLTKVAVHIRPSDLKRNVPRIVSSQLWAVLKGMRDTADPTFSGRLTDLLYAVEQGLPHMCDFLQSGHKMSELRLARMALAAQI